MVSILPQGVVVGFVHIAFSSCIHKMRLGAGTSLRVSTYLGSSPLGFRRQDALRLNAQNGVNRGLPHKYSGLYFIHTYKVILSIIEHGSP